MKTVLITGAARRIGAGIANYLHDRGYQILLHYHQSEQEAQTLCKHLLQKRPESAHLIRVDLHDPLAHQRIIEQVRHYTSNLDVLIHNASAFSKLDADWDEMFQINVKLPYFLSREAYPLLQQSKGLIINITDIHAKKPLKEYSAYVQTKAAFWMQTEALALEFAPDVRVNAVAPGSILWPEHGNVITPELQQEILNKIPLHRIGDPLFIAQAIGYLIDCPFITGQTLNVDGGRSIR